eukprot:TRINITY_DN7928_c1_g1_i1.p1 TRINITY_DN7928_c1_g1~~TRINITY_DN7928_c1_g1_i1.p1  ORF type:complete len:385 (-),score=39.22 TRINITY_DN7928_c1_g1_i1:170-1324(-)
MLQRLFQLPSNMDSTSADVNLKVSLVNVTVNSAAVRWQCDLSARSNEDPEQKTHKFEVSILESSGTKYASIGIDTSSSPGKNYWTHTFHFLPSLWKFKIKVSLQTTEAGSITELCSAKVEGQTARPPFGVGMDWEVYVSPEHELGPWVSGAPGDWMWTVEQQCSYEMISGIWRSGMFALFQQGLVLCPNPEKRFCLRVGPEEKCWSSSKKLRRHAREFRLAMNTDFAGILERCRAYHVKEHKSTWITSNLIRLLDRFRQDADSGVDVCCFELWDKEKDELAAATFSFLRGKVFHDFTMCTLVRDHRSAGHVLTKALGHLAGMAGYTCWYWGFKTAYMEDYDSYGSHYLGRDDFQNLWDAKVDESTGLHKMQDLLDQGKALVQPK